LLDYCEIIVDRASNLGENDLPEVLTEDPVLIPWGKHVFNQSSKTIDALKYFTAHKKVPPIIFQNHV
jgi:hypothetical protein